MTLYLLMDTSYSLPWLDVMSGPNRVGLLSWSETVYLTTLRWFKIAVKISTGFLVQFDIMMTILVKSYKGTSAILWDFKIYAVVVALGWGWGGEGRILAAAAAACAYGCSLNQIYRT